MATLSQQLDNRDASSEIKEIQQIRLYFGDAVLSNNTETSVPTNLSELCENTVNRPPELDAFLRTLLTGNTEIKTEYSHHVPRLVNSFGQDIQHNTKIYQTLPEGAFQSLSNYLKIYLNKYGVIGGRQKPPKQILLPYAVKT